MGLIHDYFEELTIVSAKRCSRCQIEKSISEFNKRSASPDGYHYRCKECCAYYSHKWHIENIDKKTRMSKDWYRANKEHRNRTSNAYYKNNREKILSYQKVYRQADPQRQRLRYKVYYTNGGKVKFDANRRKRDIIKRGVAGTHTPLEWLALCRKYENRCLCCGQHQPLTRDHVIPLSLGGTDDITNIQPLCLSCNDKKGTKTTDYRLNWPIDGEHRKCNFDRM